MDREMAEALGYYWPPADPLARLIKDMGDLLAQNDGQREVIDATLRSVFSAMQRVAPEHEVELQQLVRGRQPLVRDPSEGLGAIVGVAARACDCLCQCFWWLQLQHRCPGTTGLKFVFIAEVVVDLQPRCREVR